MKKMQIFVSSTYEDLKDERQKMVEAILDAGHIPAGMEILVVLELLLVQLRDGLMSQIFISFY